VVGREVVKPGQASKVKLSVKKCILA
jgi:hypothetical protein